MCIDVRTRTHARRTRGPGLPYKPNFSSLLADYGPHGISEHIKIYRGNSRHATDDGGLSVRMFGVFLMLACIFDPDIEFGLIKGKYPNLLFLTELHEFFPLVLAT